jgi:hypothetical protein
MRRMDSSALSATSKSLQRISTTNSGRGKRHMVRRSVTGAGAQAQVARRAASSWLSRRRKVLLGCDFRIRFSASCLPADDLNSPFSRYSALPLADTQDRNRHPHRHPFLPRRARRLGAVLAARRCRMDNTQSGWLAAPTAWQPWRSPTAAHPLSCRTSRNGIQ